MKIEIHTVSQEILEELRSGNGICFSNEPHEPGQAALMRIESNLGMGLACQVKDDGNYYMIKDKMIPIWDLLEK